HDPDVLLLDEPLAGLDPVSRRRVIDCILARGRAGKTVVVSSHVLHEVEAMTRQIVLLGRGRVLASGDLGEIRALLDRHPHAVAVRARDVRGLAEVLAGRDHVEALRFAAEGDSLIVETRRPEALYDAVQEHAMAFGVAEVFAVDDDLESVFRYLV